jgi:hypothetical protein
VIRLAQALLTHVDQPGALEPPRERVDPPQPRGDGRVLPHVGVDEQGAAGRDHPRRFRQHAAERVGRQVLEHVERIGLRERPVGERQPAQIAEEQVDLLPRLGGEEGRDVDAHGARAPVAVPQQRAAAAAAEIGHEIGRARREERAQHVVADPGPEERGRDALVSRVGMQRFVEILGLLLERLARAEVEKVLRRSVVPRPARGAHERRRVPRERGAARGAPHEREQIPGDHARTPTTPANSVSSRSARRAHV